MAQSDPAYPTPSIPHDQLPPAVRVPKARESRESRDDLWRARGALLGLAVADALGASFEFGSAAECSRRIAEGLEMTGGRGWLPGEITDDGDMTVCLAESIAAHGLLDLDDLAARYRVGGFRPEGHRDDQELRSAWRERCS